MFTNSVGGGSNEEDRRSADFLSRAIGFGLVRRRAAHRFARGRQLPAKRKHRTDKRISRPDKRISGPDKRIPGPDRRVSGSDERVPRTGLIFQLLSRVPVQEFFVFSLPPALHIQTI
jgi:hypothetical protein